MERKRLNDVFPKWLEGEGIMATLTTQFSVPWNEVYRQDEISLDIAYHGGHSGRKYIAPMVENFITESEPVISSHNRNLIASALWATYRRKWEKLWELYMLEYDESNRVDKRQEQLMLMELIHSTTRTLQSKQVQLPIVR